MKVWAHDSGDVVPMLEDLRKKQEVGLICPINKIKMSLPQQTLKKDFG
jgi:hypothetical protein